MSCVNLIDALQEKGQNKTGRVHVSYRNDPLTFLLQDALGGNSQTVVCASTAAAVCGFVLFRCSPRGAVVRTVLQGASPHTQCAVFVAHISDQTSCAAVGSSQRVTICIALQADT